MWLPESTYSRGFAVWNGDAVTSVFSDREGLKKLLRGEAFDDGRWLCAAVDWDAPGDVPIELELSVDPVLGQQLASLEWIRSDGVVETRVWQWNGERIDEFRLVHARTAGDSYRLVVDASKLHWDGDRVFRSGHDALRFSTQPIYGHRSKPLPTVIEDGVPSAQMGLGPDTYEGRVVEIVAHSESNGTAETRCRAMLGLLALVFGPSALGSVIFESAVSSPLNGGFTETVMGRISWNYELNLPPAAFDQGLAQLSPALRGAGAGAIRALERLAQGVGATSDELKLSAYFAGIEVIVKDFESRSGGVSWIRERGDGSRERLSIALDEIGDVALKNKLLGSLYHVPVKESFKHWQESKKFDPSAFQTLSDITKRRNSLFHEGSPGDLHQLVGDAKRLLCQMIAVEIGRSPDHVWQLYPDFQIVAPLPYEELGIKQ